MSDKPVLRTFIPAFGIPDPSPFPIKVMIFLRAHGIEFGARPGNVRKAPLQKIPFLEHKGESIPDSERILDYLEREYTLAPDDLTQEQHALGHMLCRALEERTYWAVVYFRWWHDDSFAVLREIFFASVPALLRGFIGAMVQKGVKKSLLAQGLGRHTESDIAEFMRRDYRALSALLGDKQYLFGDNISRYDCTAIAFVAMIATEGLPTRAPDILSEFPNLRAYWDRASKRFFSAG